MDHPLLTGVVLAFLLSGSSVPVAACADEPEPRCTAYVGPIQLCNFTNYCTCVLSSTITPVTGAGCFECVFLGSLACGNQVHPVPTTMECGGRAGIHGTCSGGPGFGCSFNYGQVIACSDCQ